MFSSTGKKYIKSFYEIKNQKSVAFVIQKCSWWCFVSEAFYRFGLSSLVFEIWMILWTSVFVNMTSNSPVEEQLRLLQIYLNFGVLLQENWDVILETEYGAPISIYHSLDNTKKRNFKAFLKWLMYGRSRANKNRCSQKSITFQNEIITEP